MNARVRIPAALRSTLTLAIPTAQQATFLAEVLVDSPAFAWAATWTSAQTLTNIASAGGGHGVASGGAGITAQTLPLVGAITGRVDAAAWRMLGYASSLAPAGVGPVVVASPGAGYAMEAVVRPVIVPTSGGQGIGLVGASSTYVRLSIGIPQDSQAPGTVFWSPEYVGPSITVHAASTVATPGVWLHALGSVGSVDATLRAALYVDGTRYEIYSATAGTPGASPTLSAQMYAGLMQPGYASTINRYLIDMEFAAVYAHAIAEDRVAAHYRALISSPVAHAAASYAAPPAAWVLPASYAPRGDAACTVVVVGQTSAQQTTATKCWSTQGSAGIARGGGIAIRTASGAVSATVMDDGGTAVTLSGSWDTTTRWTATVVHQLAGNPYEALYLGATLVQSAASTTQWGARNPLWLGASDAGVAWAGTILGCYVFASALAAHEVAEAARALA